MGRFPQKSPIISGSLAERHLQLTEHMEKRKRKRAKAEQAELWIPWALSLRVISCKRVISGSLAERDLQIKASCVFSPPCSKKRLRRRSLHTVRHCNTLQHTATNCNILQHTINTLHHTVLQCVAACCSVLQRVAACCSASSESHAIHMGWLRLIGSLKL